MNTDFFKNWPDDARKVLGRKVAPYLTHHESTLFHVGEDANAPYRNEIRAGWQGKQNDLLGIMKPVTDGVDLELRVGAEAAQELINKYSPTIEETKDGSTNWADKIIVHLAGSEPPPELGGWIRKAYSFVVGKRPLK